MGILKVLLHRVTLLQGFNMEIGMDLVQMARPDLGLPHKAHILRVHSRGHLQECNHSRGLPQDKGLQEARLRVLCLRIPVVPRHVLSGTGLQDQVCLITQEGLVFPHIASLHLCKAPLQGRDPLQEGHHQVKWEDPEVLRQVMAVPLCMGDLLRDRLHHM